MVNKGRAVLRVCVGKFRDGTWQVRKFGGQQSIRALALALPSLDGGSYGYVGLASGSDREADATLFRWR